ncbi:DUF4440 domain-containing protein [Lacinutrix iliipiscaria]|uniref:DUF4440 domain-containing protein n=1 Tax=Lacinutrix iliipiscaria TaxID=1230532 RepID=A0ABW5WMB4_9FLAO
MKKIIILFTLVIISNLEVSLANNYKSDLILINETLNDSTRLAELDRYWAELSRTVKEGDFEAYAATYHKDAVVVFATGKNKTSVALSQALDGWKEGFIKTKEGKQNDAVQFRFSQRIGNETTAHETGIFRFTSKELDGKLIAEYTIHFEMLLIKRNGKWLGVMEHQKNAATDEEWSALEK